LSSSIGSLRARHMSSRDLLVMIEARYSIDCPTLCFIWHGSRYQVINVFPNSIGVYVCLFRKIEWRTQGCNIIVLISLDSITLLASGEACQQYIGSQTIKHGKTLNFFYYKTY
jgi:hypothetical protein